MDPTAGNAAGNRGGAEILEPWTSSCCQRSQWSPSSLVLCLVVVVSVFWDFGSLYLLGQTSSTVFSEQSRTSFEVASISEELCMQQIACMEIFRSDFNFLGTLVLCIKGHGSAGHRVVCIAMDQMVGNRQSPGATILGGENVYLCCQPSLYDPADRLCTS